MITFISIFVLYIILLIAGETIKHEIMKKKREKREKKNN